MKKYIYVSVFFLIFVTIVTYKNSEPIYIYDFDIFKGYTEQYPYLGKVYKNDTIYVIHKNGKNCSIIGEQIAEIIIYRHNGEKKIKISNTSKYRDKYKAEIWLPADYKLEEYKARSYQEITEKYNKNERNN